MIDWSSLADHVVLAQTAPGFDPSVLLQQGPLGVIAVFMFYLWRRSEDRYDKAIDAHKVEIAAERALNSKQQDQRITDQQTIVPLAQNLVKVAEKLDERLEERKQ